MTEKYKVTGMSCAACSARVERAVSELEGVESCSVNLLTGDMSVVGEATRARVISAVVRAGYGVDDEPVSAKTGDLDDKGGNAQQRALIARLCISLALTLVLMSLSMGQMVGLRFTWLSPVWNAALQMMLAVSVMIINHKFFVNGVKGILHGAPNMDTLVSLGSFSSFAYSVAIFIMMVLEASEGIDASHRLHRLYFESAAMILALMLNLFQFLKNILMVKN